MNEYKITNVMRDGEWSGQYGPMVTFKLAFEGEEGWIKLNQKLTTPEPRAGMTLTGTISDETTSNGEAYRKFTKVNPQYANQPSRPQQSQASSQESYIVQMLEELTGRRQAPDKVITEVPDRPMDPNDIPF